MIDDGFLMFIEFFLLLDLLVIVEYIKKVMYFEDDDIVYIYEGFFYIYCFKKVDGSSNVCIIQIFEFEFQEIMKGKFDYFM